MGAVREKIFFGAMNAFLKKYYPENPLRTRIIQPYFTDPYLYTYKQAGRRIIFFFYTPLLVITLIILYILWRMVVACLCRRKEMANRHGTVHAAASGKKTEKVE